ncbi:hypothetical protein [Rhizobium sp. ICMP 5592]|uniref:hypothetical protein n=1 Tax=Rhizobium sp. ICMP 5592 TaxID=2292445 RepID=UPI00336A2EA6
MSKTATAIVAMLLSDSSRQEVPVSSRIAKSWLVFISIENIEHDRCVDLFERSDGTCGFEEFRRDAEDWGTWTPVSFFSIRILPTRKSSLEAAIVSVPWLVDVVERYPSAVRLLQ